VMRYDTGLDLSIPTLSEWGVVAMLLLLMSVGTVVFLKRWRHCRHHA
jgi:hypothetical protein